MNKIQPVTKLVDFVEYTDWRDLIAKHFVFRGQPDEEPLLPGIARNNPPIDITLKETELLEQLQLYGASLLRDYDENMLDLLVRAQHFGLRTRLLDWTSNPLAALWFACFDKKYDGNVCVYALEGENLLRKDVYTKYKENPFTNTELLLFQPRFSNSRLIAQDGWFTLHPYLAEDKRFSSVEETGEYLVKFLISAECRKDVIRSLALIGISSRTLFPDLSGLCEYLNWEHGV